MMLPQNSCSHRHREYTHLLTNGVVERFEWECPCGARGVDTQHALDPVQRAEILHAAGLLVTEPVFHSPAYLHRQLASR